MSFIQSLGKKNLCQAERIVRTGLGVVFMLGGAFMRISELGRVLLVLAGLVLLATGLAGSCAVYSALGWNTNQEEKK